MELTYFPFTTMDRAILKRVNRCLGPVLLYRPSALALAEPLALAEAAGALEVCRPEKGDGPELAAMRDAYREWLQVHQGGATGWLKVHGADIPFFDEDATSRIRNQLRGRMAGPGGRAGEDLLFNARLFLEMVQELDIQQQEIDADLTALQDSEQALFRTLRADPEAMADLPPAVPPRPGGLTLPAQRMAAWGRLVLAHRRPPTPLLATDSRDAFEWALERSGNAEPVPLCQPLILGPVAASPESCSRLGAFFDDLTTAAGLPGEPPDPGELSAGGDLALTLYRLPGQSPEQLLARWSKQAGGQEATAPAFPHTLVGWLQVL